MSNQQKIPLSRTLPNFVQQRVLAEISKRGRALPGHVVAVDGPIVTVNFDVTGAVLPQVTMPILGAEYVRYPIQVGDKGVTFPVDVYTGQVSGLGPTGTAADFSTQQGNLATLMWVPCGNKNWSPVNPNALVLYGPDGVVLKDTAGETTFTLTPSGITISGNTSLTFSVGSHSIVINSSGVTIDGVLFLAHAHSAVQTGPDVSGPVVP
jgi:hypothetical protein